MNALVFDPALKGEIRDALEESDSHSAKKRTRGSQQTATPNTRQAGYAPCSCLRLAFLAALLSCSPASLSRFSFFFFFLTDASPPVPLASGAGGVAAAADAASLSRFFSLSFFFFFFSASFYPSPPFVLLCISFL